MDFHLNDMEYDKAKNFWSFHKTECKIAISTLSFTKTPIGMFKHIKCICGESMDITVMRINQTD